MKTVDAGNVLVFLDVTKTERKQLLAAAENEPSGGRKFEVAVED